MSSLISAFFDVQGHEDKIFLIAFFNAAINFIACYFFAKEFHRVVAIGFAVLFAISDRYRIEDPQLSWVVLGATGAIGGCLVGLVSKGKGDA